MDKQSIPIVQSPTQDNGDQASRVVVLEQSLLDKNRAIDELNETSKAFKLLNEKQVAELNAKDILLARKNERIDELLQQLKDRDLDLQARERLGFQLQLKTETLEAEVQDLKEQLLKEEDEFAMLSAAMATKDVQLQKRLTEITTLKEAEMQLHKDLDRLQVQLRRLEKHVSDLQPETMDACLSPRSFRENQLIQLRDDAITAKTKEIWILTGQNDQLRIQLDDIEAEVERLQTSYVAKENDIARRDRKLEKLEVEIESLQVSRQQALGRERAIEIATTQNAKLLQALQALEAENGECKIRLDQAETECSQLRLVHRQHMAMSAVQDVEGLHQAQKAELKASMLSTLQDKLVRERKALHEELTRERMQSQVEVEKLQSELVMRRNKQYELTLRLQEVEAKCHDTTDALELTSEQLIVTKLRMDDAERVLQDALGWKHALEEELVACRDDTDQAKREWAKQLAASQAEGLTLRGQLTELKESLLKTLDDGKRKEVKMQDWKRSIEGKDQLLGEQKDRIHRLVQEVAKGGQARAEIELEKKVLTDQLERLKLQMADALRECMVQQRGVEEKYKKETTKFKDLEQELASEQRGKTRLLRLFTHAYGAFPAAMPHGIPPIKPPLSSCLDLRECWLTDHDLAPVFSMLETNAALRKHLTRVDLRANRITQEGMRVIIRYLHQCLPSSPASIACLRELDLRGNFVSIEGVRLVANALEGMASVEPSRDAPIAKVLVVNGGRIECYPDAVVAPNEIPMLTIDISENGDADTLFLPPNSSSKPLDRRKREEGPVRTVDPVLQQIYGLDLVNAFMSETKPVAMGPASSRTRRKGSERLRVASNNDSATLVDLPLRPNPQATASPRLHAIADAPRPPFLSSSASLPRL